MTCNRVRRQRCKAWIHVPRVLRIRRQCVLWPLMALLQTMSIALQELLTEEHTTKAVISMLNIDSKQLPSATRGALIEYDSRLCP